MHCLRCSYVAKIWKTSDVCRVHAPPVQDHGWTEDNDILWAENAFPDDIETILCNVDEDLNFEESKTDSSDDDNSEDEEDDTED